MEKTVVNEYCKYRVIIIADNMYVSKEQHYDLSCSLNLICIFVDVHIRFTGNQTRTFCRQYRRPALTYFSKLT